MCRLWWFAACYGGGGAAAAHTAHAILIATEAFRPSKPDKSTWNSVRFSRVPCVTWDVGPYLCGPGTYGGTKTVNTTQVH